MGYRHLVHVLTRHCFLVLILACFSVTLSIRAAKPQQTPPSKETTPPPNVERFLPANAVLTKKLTVNFRNAAEPESIVLAYTMPSERPPYYFAGVRIVRQSSVSGWTVAYEETNPSQLGGDELTIQKVKALGGQEGVAFIYYYSGAGTTTDWKVIALVNGKFIALSGAPIRDKVLKKRGYIFMGYNGVSVKGDVVIEEISGYSHGRARCCPDKPSIEMRVKFTGTSIKLDSVKQLPFTSPKD